MPVPKFKTLGFRGNDIKSGESKSDQIENDLPEIVQKLSSSEKKSLTPFNLKIIPRCKIIFNEKNDYEQIDIDKLADTILHFGLIHCLEGYYDEEQDRYVIESGERRTRAIDFLLKKYADYDDKESADYKDYLTNVKGYEAGYPINVKKKRFEGSEVSRLDEIDSEIRLMDANEEVRPENPQDKFKRVTRRAKLIEERNALLPRKERINVNKEIGSKLGMSERQVQKYKNLNELIPELREEFFANNITLTEGANYALLTTEEQYNILKLIQAGKKVSSDDVKRLKQEKENIEMELNAKEEELENLREEGRRLQKEHQKKLEAAQQEIESDKARLKEQLQLEMQNNSPDKKRVEELESKLRQKEKADKENRETLNNIQKKLNDKNGEIERLEKQLSILKSTPAQDIESLRAETKFAVALENTLNAVDSLIKEFNHRAEGIEIKKYQSDLKRIIDAVSGLIIHK